MKIRYAALMICSGVAVLAQASTYSTDFTSMGYGTPVSSGPDVTYSLYGGPDSAGTPVVGWYSSYYGVMGLQNSTNLSYPTAEGLVASFAAPVSGVSFTFDDEGSNGGAQDAYVYSGSTLIDIINIDTWGAGDSYGGVYGQGYFSVPGSGITAIYFDNGTGGNYSWDQTLDSITYSTGTPAPAATLVFALGALGKRFRRRR